MKRLAYIISTFLILTGYSSVVSSQLETLFDETGNSISEFHQRYRGHYLDLSGQGGVSSSLATAPNGCWAGLAKYRGQKHTLKSQALYKCKTYCNTTCKIVDVNGTSAFIKQRGSSGSTTTASSSGSKFVWCATKDHVIWIREKYCRQEGERSFSSKYQAQVEHKRLKGSSSSSSSTASSSNTKKIFCATASYWWSTDWVTCSNEGGKAFSTVSQAQAERKRLKGSSSGSTVTASSSSSAVASSGSKFVWCATKDWVIWKRGKYCGQESSFSTKSQAEAEHTRLKGGTTPVVKTASLTIRSNVTGDSVYIDGIYKGSTRLGLNLSKGRYTIRIEKDGYKTYEEGINLTDNLIIWGHLEKIVEQPVQTVVVDNTVEVEFWNSIKGSDDPDEYRIYLDEYPTGKFAKLAKLRIKKLGGETTSVAQSSIPDLNYGDYYALVIGNNRYEHLGDLRTAVNDARAVSSLLEDGYGFNVKRLENATRSDILNSITELRGKVGRKDNVLIYYAGHGVEDKAADEGFWIPTDAKLEEQDNWLSTDRVRKQIKAMPAKHVMVVADSCFSGTILRSSDITRGLKIERTSPEYEHYLKRIVEDKSRTALTSGGLEPVMDSGGGEHSVFANFFLSILRDNESVLDAQRLFSELRPKVMANSNQKPEYGTIHLAGDDGGDFLFVKTAKLSMKSLTAPSVEKAATPDTTTSVWEPVKWCVKSGSPFRATKSNCLADGGNYYETKNAAKSAATSFSIQYRIPPAIYKGEVSACIADVGSNTFRRITGGLIREGTQLFRNDLLPVIHLAQGYYNIKLTKGITCNSRTLYQNKKQYIGRSGGSKVITIFEKEA